MNKLNNSKATSVTIVTLFQINEITVPRARNNLVVNYNFKNFVKFARSRLSRKLPQLN